MSNSLWPHGLQYARLPCPSPSPRVCICPNSCLWSRWCHPTIYPLLFPSPLALNLSQHQGLFQFLARARPLINVSLEEWPILFLTLFHIRSLAFSRGLSITLFSLLDVSRKGETPCHQVSGRASSWTLHPALGTPRRPGCNSTLQAPELSHGVAHCLGFPPRMSALPGIW